MEWDKGIPIPTTWRIWDLDVDEPIVLFPFRELIGALLWIALLTRPDIAYAVLVYRDIPGYNSIERGSMAWNGARVFRSLQLGGFGI